MCVCERVTEVVWLAGQSLGRIRTVCVATLIVGLAAWEAESPQVASPTGSLAGLFVRAAGELLPQQSEGQ